MKVYRFALHDVAEETTFLRQIEWPACVFQVSNSSALRRRRPKGTFCYRMPYQTKFRIRTLGCEAFGTFPQCGALVGLEAQMQLASPCTLVGRNLFHGVCDNCIFYSVHMPSKCIQVEIVISRFQAVNAQTISFLHPHSCRR